MINLYEETVDIVNNKIRYLNEINDNDKEMSNNYIITEKCKTKNKIIVDNINYIARDVININEDHESTSLDECRKIKYCPKVKKNNQVYINLV